jgi:hypothetical protein
MQQWINNFLVPYKKPSQLPLSQHKKLVFVIQKLKKLVFVVQKLSMSDLVYLSWLVGTRDLRPLWSPLVSLNLVHVLGFF